VTGELIGVREAARQLNIHENSVRNWHKTGVIHAAQAYPLKFTGAEVNRVRTLLEDQAGLNHLERAALLRDAEAGLGRAYDPLGDADGTVVGILVKLQQLPAGMTPREALLEVAKGIRFGKPEITLHFVTGPAREGT
jgi:hypothetical protein